MGFPFVNDDLRTPRVFVGSARALLIAIAALALFGCGGGGSDSSPEKPPTSANPDPPTEPDPPAVSGSATLNWTPPVSNVDGTSLANLAGFRIYYGHDPNDLGTLIDLDNPGLTAYTVDGLSAGTWYFAMTAYSASGTESSLSKVNGKTIE